MIAALLTFAVLGVTAASCVSDLRTMRIPNRHSAFILAAFAVAFVFSPESFGRWWEHVGAFALMFAITFSMFSLGMLGSGDTKLGSVLALWVGLKGLMIYLLYMTVAGGLLGLASLVLRRKKIFPDAPQESWVAKVQDGKSVVPYGIAISFGFWMVLFHTGFLHHRLDELIVIIH
jgi:Flp pilus assembly protein protease CpaA